MQVDWTIYLTFLGVGLILLLPRDSKNLIRWVALLTGVAALLVALKNYFAYDAWVAAEISAHGSLRDGFQQVVNVPWIPALNVNYHLAVDGINFPLIVLNGFVCVTGILFSWNVENRVKEFFAFFLTLIAGVYGVFMAMDLFLLFVFYELAIIPKYFVIAIWGSTRKEYGAMKLVLYSFVGSALVFIGILAVYFSAGGQTFDILELVKHPLAPSVQVWVFPLIFVGFAILAGMWPFHTWAPTGHVAAPTAASMLLAGVVMKLGAYGCLRVAIGVFPHGLDAWSFTFLGLGSWRDVFALLAVIGIVYGALVALAQSDFKFVIGYSSVSHMGFVLLGLMTLNQIGVDGAVLQMFSHGVIAGLLFAIVGRVVYDRTHTRQFAELEPMHLSRRLPFAAWAFVFAGIASMGLPGFSGFVAELQVLVGAWQANPWWTIVSGIGIIVGVAYVWRALQKAFFSDRLPTAHELEAEQEHKFAPITWPEY